MLTALFPGPTDSLHGARTHPVQVEHSKGISCLSPASFLSTGSPAVWSGGLSPSERVARVQQYPVYQPLGVSWSHDNCQEAKVWPGRTTVKCSAARSGLHTWPLEFKQIEVDLPLSCSVDLSLSGTCAFQRTRSLSSGDSRQSCAYLHQPGLVEGWTVQRGVEAGVTLSLQL